MKKVLVLEDEASIRSFIVINLQRAGYEVVEAECGEEALQKLQENPDTKLCLLDIMLPDIDGFEVCRRIRMSNAQVGIIMLTARTQEMDKVTGLMTGADDYVTKPYNPQELAARVRSQLRRYTLLGDVHAEKREGEIVNGRLSYDPERRELKADGELVKLTATELKIVDLLMRNPGRVFPAEEIYQRVWQSDSYACENTVMVHIRRIREKIELNPKEPDYIKVVWGIGYKMEQHN
mgnify:CR=1 FL=1